MDIRLEPREGYFLVTAGGPYDGAVARGAIGRIRGECLRLGLQRVLVDARRLDETVSISDRFDLARALAEGRTAVVRFAILVRPQQMVTKTLEDSATNRGVPVRTTASEREAYGFLGLAPPA
jgi:hypothetical protein